MTTRKRVVVIGGGFGGLAAVQALASADVDVTLIDRVNHQLFQPLLYQVATAGLAAPSIAAPLRHILRRQANATVLMGDVEAIDLSARCVHLARQTFGYDYLIVASGAAQSYFGHDEWAQHVLGLKTLDDALAIRGRVLTAFEQAELETDPQRRAAWLTFVIVGGGSTGVELAGTLAEIARHTLAPEFRRSDPRQAQVLLLEAGTRVLASLPPDLSAKASEQLKRLGVTVRTGQGVTGVGAEYVELGAERIPTRTILWAAGVAASPLGSLLDVPPDRSGARAGAAGPLRPRTCGSVRDRRPCGDDVRRASGAWRGACGQADGRACSEEHLGPHHRASEHARSATVTTARSPPLAAARRSSISGATTSPAPLPGGSGSPRTSSS